MESVELDKTNQDIMKLIKKLDTRREFSIKNTHGVLRRWGLFLCEKCGDQVEKRFEQGSKNGSCGCVNRSMVHNDYGKKIYNSWAKIIQRCTNKNNKRYHRYGGRGISVCDDWLKYKNFRKWALSNGYSDKLFIDRIDNDGNYEPGNCRFISSAGNAQNRETTKLNWTKVNLIRIFYKYKIFNGPELAKMYNISTPQVYTIASNRTWIA